MGVVRYRLDEDGFSWKYVGRPIRVDLKPPVHYPNPTNVICCPFVHFSAYFDVDSNHVKAMLDEEKNRSE